jgi:hypothetical protein
MLDIAPTDAQRRRVNGNVHQSEKRQPPKAIGYRKSLDVMRKPEGALMKTAGVYHLEPGGYYVEPKTAEKLIQHPQVRSAEDGLWPGLSQTWRFKAGE